MKNFADSSSKNLAKTSKFIPWAFLVTGLIGFLDAAYLTAEHYLGGVPPCLVLEGCEKVLTSPYATVWGVSIALFGAIYYLTIIILTFLYLDTNKLINLKLAAYLAGVGFLASLGFIYLQIFVIGAICFYCMVSALTSTTLFILGLLTIKSLGRAAKKSKTPEATTNSAI